MDWFRSPFLFSWIKPDQLFLETIFQQLSHQWGQSLFTDRRCNQLSECLVKSPFGKSLPCFMSLSHFPGALVEAQRDDWLHATLLCQVGSLQFRLLSAHFRSFTFVEKTSEEANWARNWSSAFYLDVKTSSYIHQTEFYACNSETDFVNLTFHSSISFTYQMTLESWLVVWGVSWAFFWAGNPIFLDVG